MRPELLLIPLAVLALLVVVLGPAGPVLPGVEPLDPPPAGAGEVQGPEDAESAEQGPAPEDQPEIPPRKEAEVLLVDRAFEPARLSLPPGTLLRFLNRAAETHTATVRLAGEDALLLDAHLGPGEEAALTLDASGNYELRCRFHSAAFGEGMAGGIEVVAR